MNMFEVAKRVNPDLQELFSKNFEEYRYDVDNNRISNHMDEQPQDMKNQKRRQSQMLKKLNTLKHDDSM